MSASLVGSEMCIRDSYVARSRRVAAPGADSPASRPETGAPRGGFLHGRGTAGSQGFPTLAPECPTLEP
eukprot:7163586-Alexandrium_andersonii.AAC.1